MKDPFSQIIKERGKFSISQYIRPDERDTLTGPFPSSGGSVYTFTFASNFTHPNHRYIEFEEKVPNTFCFASRPVSKNGSNNYLDSIWSYKRFISSLDDDSAPKDAPYYSPLIFTFGFLLLAIYWIYAMVSQRSKVLPAQYGLLLLTISSAFGTPFFFWWTGSCNDTDSSLCTPSIVGDVKESFDIFIERLVLYFVAFGFGVWRLTRGNLVSGGTILLLIPVVFRTVLKLIYWKFGIFETSFYLIDEFLNDSSNNLIWMYAIYYLYQTYTSTTYMKSKYSIRLVKQSLFYCVGMITLRPFVSAYLTTVTLWTPVSLTPNVGDFIHWIIRYGAEVMIPCYIWRPSQNELVCYNEEEYTESK
ncbi:hypothetical protein SPOG_05513 [Schizosaccharomyces cryophilus OY26]|uniref:Uncharacterized protein n=1 Tax=Schizosaccharomyces cryophilus (strain OY26 / ATCC MYA-4695 / CBS 11777 / NBRC 106824 / NRRL Y48691) TaxID=653667 RepID=S9VZX8_SCHCR|nr:uncharacterized protein SPOG_05513 [Schizosaccharomyces cryophilus OY26]EPY53243.1 hypothetical protein SPOG_05513 [Schizosaccharomyces cryophilus OY26]